MKAFLLTPLLILAGMLTGIFLVMGLACAALMNWMIECGNRK